MLRDMVQDGVLRFKVKMFNKLFPIGKHLYAMEVYPMLKVIYNGVRSDDIFDAYVSEVKKHYKEYPEKSFKGNEDKVIKVKEARSRLIPI